MIDRTFLHLPRTGVTTERKLWQQGIGDWNAFLTAGTVAGFSREKKLAADDVLRDSQRALHRGESAFFLSLPTAHHWRLYPAFADEAVFVDIETNWGGDVTVLGVYDGKRVKQFVRGENLTARAVKEHVDGKLLVTYNGASFDLPVLRRCFGQATVAQVPHFDTMHLARKLGYRGGLKALEVSIGIRRPDMVAGMSGQDALTLWELYRKTGNEEHLKTLLAYNEEDIVNLQRVARHLVREGSDALIPVR
jgi:uncharacterized protein YprB with RNaseH-like and TPR domain